MNQTFNDAGQNLSKDKKGKTEKNESNILFLFFLLCGRWFFGLCFAGLETN